MSRPSFRRVLVGSIAVVLIGCAHNAPRVGCEGPLRPINTTPEQPSPDDDQAQRDSSTKASRESSSDETTHGR